MPSLTAGAGSNLDIDHGTATITSGASTEVVSHTLGNTPEAILVTPRTSAVALAVTARTWSDFTVTRSGTTGDLSFDWFAYGIEVPAVGGAYQEVVLDDAPLLFWALDDPSLPTAAAAIGDPGTYYNTPGLREPGPGPGLPYAVSLNGTDQYVYQAYDSDLDVGAGPFAFEVWAKSTGTGNRTLFGRDHTATGNGQLVYLWGGVPRLYTGGTQTDGGPNLHDGAWHHLVYQRAGSNHEFWVDGTRVINTGASNNTNISAQLRVGVADGVSAGHFQGLMAGFAYYNRALTSGEIAAHIAAV